MPSSENLFVYELSNFRKIHRSESKEDFGFNQKSEQLALEGFEIYSTDGINKGFGPLKGNFFLIGLNLTGNARIDLNNFSFQHTPNSIYFKSPDKQFEFSSPSTGFYGYYLLFTEKFIETVVPNFNHLQHQFPFLGGGVPVFELSQEESVTIRDLILNMEREFKQKIGNREWMLGSYIFQLFISAHRSYSRQNLLVTDQNKTNASILDRFNQLVEKHYRAIHGVKEYADMLHVSPSHLNRLIKQQSGRTPSVIIQERLVTEIKSILRYSNKPIAEVAFELHFTDTAHFSHFFKQATGQSPLAFRKGG
jgi:AraC family transcriptional regulator, transcriptional activator of pobA